MKKYLDLHLHLDGAITVEIAKKLAALQGINLPSENDAELEKLLVCPKDCESLNDFLKCFALPLSLLQTRESITEAVKLVMEDEAKGGALYAELRFAPQLHTEKGLTQEDVILAVLDGMKESPIKCNLILICMRGEDNEAENMLTLELCKKYLTDDVGVVAADLAGAEALFPNDNYIALFAKARENGIPFTVHAGEALGAQSVKIALEAGAVRIGHGVRSREDESVMSMLRERKIPLEMCPSSNLLSHAVDSLEDYPLLDYLNSGLAVTINTDDPAIVSTDISRENELVDSLYHLTELQKKQLLENSVAAAFMSDSSKAKLRSELGL